MAPSVATQLEWLTGILWVPPPAGSNSLTRSDFLSNEKSQLDVDRFGLDRAKRPSTEYPAVVRLRALITQADMELVQGAGSDSEEGHRRSLRRRRAKGERAESPRQGSGDPDAHSITNFR